MLHPLLFLSTHKQRPLTPILKCCKTSFQGQSWWFLYQNDPRRTMCWSWLCWKEKPYGFTWKQFSFPDGAILGITILFQVLPQKRVSLLWTKEASSEKLFLKLMSNWMWASLLLISPARCTFPWCLQSTVFLFICLNYIIKLWVLWGQTFPRVP